MLRWTVFAGVVLAGLILVGLAAAGTGDETLVYDATSGTYIPTEVAAALQQQYNSGTAVPTETAADSDPLATPESQPDGLYPASDVAGAYSPITMSPTNVWVTQSDTTFTSITAGADDAGTAPGLPDALRQGALLVTQENLVSGDTSGDEYLAPAGTGTLTITGGQGTAVTFSGASGVTGTFDAATGVLTLNP